MRLNGYGKLESTPKKAIIWPHKKTSPLKELIELIISEYTYIKNGNNYSFINHE